MEYKKIEEKWQKKWEKDRVFNVKEGKDKKFYVLEMFPYPSASGLHMGHALNYTIGDVFARCKRMNGFNVMYPMGFDALGLPAENAAIKAKSHPRIFTEKAIKNYIRQMKELGLSYDWSRMVSTMDKEYYKWNQYFFLKFMEKGLVYRKKAPVNWCPKCDTVLANEQVHNGKCWRHEDSEVGIKQLEQWFIKTTKYADELLKMLDNLEWPDRVKTMQKNWIGKSYGTEINFEINGKKWPIFTTRPDTIYGVTFMVVSAQHPKLMELVSNEQKKEVEKFLKKIKSVSEKEMEELEKEGAFTGSYAINPMNREKIPVYTGNFVLADYGSGMVMAVPAHDQRDFEFAKKYNIPIKIVIQSEQYNIDAKKMSRAYTSDGKLIDSGEFNGQNNKEAIENITRYLEKKRLGNKAIQFKLKDWLISRQRYWGTPIPIVYCDACGIVPVDEKDLPVVLPEKVKFGKGNPLESAESWIKVKCPKCKKYARRETDTMDTFFDSSWYYLRYCDNKNNKEPFDKKKIKYWMPVDQYIGGVEHACMHLIYARFFTKALRDLGFLDFDEPFIRLFNQGVLHGPDGEKMSKSKGNVINPDNVSKEYGMDTARFFLLSLAAPDKPRDWSEEGIQGSLRFINRVFEFANNKFSKSNPKVESKVNIAIKEITDDMNKFRYNMAIIKIRGLFDVFIKEGVDKKDFEKFLKILSPFCPHIAEELWHKLGNKSFISIEKWPEIEEKKINKKLDAEEEFIERTLEDIKTIIRFKNLKVNKVYLYVIPNEIKLFESVKENYEKELNLKVEVYAVNDNKKYDPENKSKKAKPGKPGIFLE